MTNMASVRQQLLQRFPIEARVQEPDAAVADSLYALLWPTDVSGQVVDGWILFRIVRESNDSLEAIGLMTLLPSGSVPIAVNIQADPHGLAWTAKVGQQDSHWHALSDSKRWNRVYLYATGGREEPPWTWDREHRGFVRHVDD
jgi:hypothetical protein